MKKHINLAVHETCNPNQIHSTAYLVALTLVIILTTLALGCLFF